MRQDSPYTNDPFASSLCCNTWTAFFFLYAHAVLSLQNHVVLVSLDRHILPSLYAYKADVTALRRTSLSRVLQSTPHPIGAGSTSIATKFLTPAYNPCSHPCCSLHFDSCSDDKKTRLSLPMSNSCVQTLRAIGPCMSGWAG